MVRSACLAVATAGNASPLAGRDDDFMLLACVFERVCAGFDIDFASRLERAGTSIVGIFAVLEDGFDVGVLGVNADRAFQRGTFVVGRAVATVRFHEQSILPVELLDRHADTLAVDDLGILLASEQKRDDGEAQRRAAHASQSTSLRVVRRSGRDHEQA